MLHHKAHLYEDQLKIFERLTADSAELTDPETAYSEIDRVFDAVIQNKRPGYIELPRDMVSAIPVNPEPRKPSVAEARSVLRHAFGSARCGGEQDQLLPEASDSCRSSRWKGMT
jgi:TPP-dependent 2-oxoacid decarboxylase